MTLTHLTEAQLEQFHRNGYLIIESLLSRPEVESLRDHFMELHKAGPVEGLFEPLPADDGQEDILRVYPRFMHPHRVDELSKNLMLDPRFRAVLSDLLEEEPIAAQSMFYYKPPGGRGQALHQDNFYLAVAPGTCMAAWVAVDDIDPENGGLFVVPGSHLTELQCPHAADLTKSFATEEVDMPEGMSPIPTHLKAGDVLFFNGSLIHGSYPNESADRFRRSFICHYVAASCTELSKYFFPLLTFDATEIEAGEQVSASIDGGMCGTEEWAALERARGNAEVLV